MKSFVPERESDAMNLNQLEKQLHSEGFRHTYVWEDGPDRRYSDHTHPVETAHIILEGQMTLTMGGRSATSARMGSDGCRYLIGEK